jgi:hypothetical protein
VPEVRRLLLLLAEPDDAARDHHLRWSVWRRRHQAVSRLGHRQRRAQRLSPAPPSSPATPGPIPVLLVPGTVALSESAWAQIAALVQPAAPHRGHPSGDLRRQLEGMLALMHNGGPWREVPPAYGPWQTIYTRYAFWVRTGLWDHITAILHPDLLERPPAAPP